MGLLQVDGLPDVKGLPWRYAVISPGASRRRPCQGLGRGEAYSIAQLFMEFGPSCVLVGGNDTAECDGHHRRTRAPSWRCPAGQDLAGKISLRELAAVLKKAKLFVGIDSGVMHMARPDIPTVGIFGPTDPSMSRPRTPGAWW